MRRMCFIIDKKQLDSQSSIIGGSNFVSALKLKKKKKKKKKFFKFSQKRGVLKPITLFQNMIATLNLWGM